MKGGQLHRGQPGRDRPDDADPARAEGRHGDGGEQHRQQRARQPRPAPSQEKEKPQDRQGDREDGRLDVAKPAGERADLGEEYLAGDRDPGHVLELVGDHDQGHARHVADQDGPGK